MAENEALSLGPESVRWVSVKHHLDEGISFAVDKKVEKVFRDHLKYYWKHLADLKIDPQQFFAGANSNSPEFSRYLKTPLNDDCTRSLVTILKVNRNVDNESMFRKWLWSIWDFARDIIELDRRDHSVQVAVKQRLEYTIDHIASRLARNSRVVPRKPRGTSQLVASDPLDDNLRFNLLP